MVDLHDVIEREVMLDGIFAGAPVGFALFDPDLRIRRVNEAYAALTGLPRADHEGLRVEQVLPGVAAAATAMLAQVLRTGEPATGVLVAAQPDEGRPSRRFEASFIPLVLPGGGVAGLASMINEVTDRHEAEQRQAQLVREARAAEDALRGQRDLYETLLRAQSEAGEGFVLFDGERITYANEAAERLTGRSVDELRALPSWLELVAARAPRRAARAASPTWSPGACARPALPDRGRRAPTARSSAIEVAARALRTEGGVQLVVLGATSPSAAAQSLRARAAADRRSAPRAARSRPRTRARPRRTRSARRSRARCACASALQRGRRARRRRLADVIAIDVIPRARRGAGAGRGRARTTRPSAREMERTLGRGGRCGADHVDRRGRAERRAGLGARRRSSSGSSARWASATCDEQLARGVRIHACAIVPLIARGDRSSAC